MKKKFRNKHASNSCQQLWSSRWCKDNKQINEGLVLKHVIRRRFLGIAQDVKIEYGSAFKKKKANLKNLSTDASHDTAQHATDSIPFQSQNSSTQEGNRSHAPLPSSQYNLGWRYKVPLTHPQNNN